MKTGSALAVSIALWTVAAVGCAPEAPAPPPTPSDSAAETSESTPESSSPAPSPPAHAPEEAATRLHRGIDVSVHSGSVDWQKVAAEGHGFAIFKATEGVDLADGAFAEHWHRAAEAGLVRGAYHFYVTEDDPHAQADWFTAHVVLQPGDLAPIVDVELVGHGTPEGWQENLLTFVERLHEHYGTPPIVYTSPTFWQELVHGPAPEVADALSGHPLWIAEYGVEEPLVPPSWSTWHMWQYRGDTPVAGVEKGADLTQVHRDAFDPSSLLVGSGDSR